MRRLITAFLMLLLACGPAFADLREAVNALGKAKRELSSAPSSVPTRFSFKRAMSPTDTSPVTYTPSKQEASKPSSLGAVPAVASRTACFMASTSW